MKVLRLGLTLVILIMTAIVGFAQDSTSSVTDPVFIYQNGRLTSINPDTDQTVPSVKSLKTLIFQPNLSALWTAYDKNRNRVYMIVEREPWDPKTGKQLRSVVALDLSTSKEEILYTDYYLVGGAISPDGSKLLIHQYKVGSQSIMPMASQICVLDLSINSCDIFELKGLAFQFEWINESEFITPVLGVLYLCFANKTSCQSLGGLEKIYVDRVAKSERVNQTLIAGQLTPYDGTTHYFYYDVIAHQLTEIEQLRKDPIYNSDNLAVLQDVIDYIELSADGRYLVTGNELFASEMKVLDVISGCLIAAFQGSRPQWVGDSNTLIDIGMQDNKAEVYTFDIKTGRKTILYTTDQPFNLVVP